MPGPRKGNATRDDLFKTPKNTTGEIINGELIVIPVHPGSTCSQRPPSIRE
ncbi:MAG: hypothetical protein ABFD97_09885 [Syntrophobacter sp.]